MLTESETESLDNLGYLSLGKLLNDEDLEVLRSRIHELVIEEGEEGGFELFDSKHIKHPKEAGADRLANLVNKGEMFDMLYTQDRKSVV